MSEGNEGDYFSGKNGKFKLNCAHLSFSMKKSIKNGGNPQERRETIRNYLKQLFEEEEKDSFVSHLQENLSTFPSFLIKTNQACTPVQNGSYPLILLHFFTYCCSNCLCTIPRLDILEDDINVYSEYDQLSQNPFLGVNLISVHGAKFPNEKADENLRDALKRYSLRHLVISDVNKKLYKEFGVVSWPTFVLYSKVHKRSIFQISGEENLNQVKEIAVETLEMIRRDGLDHLHFELVDVKGVEVEEDREQVNPLRYPGGIAVDRAGGFVYIADSGNHRIIKLDIEGKILGQIGSGKKGMFDGDFASSEFYFPQGLCLDPKNSILYVCDTFNHAIRRVDLIHQKVEIIVGNGIKGSSLVDGKSGRDQEIALPWGCDLDYYGDLMISMSVWHQLWKVNMETRVANRMFGSGIEACRDSDKERVAAFAQPSLMSFDREGKILYVADSESSTIRKIDVERKRVETLVGGDPNNYFNLNAFGDIDGVGREAKLQHPLGVKFISSRNSLIIADTYNNKIKELDLVSNSLKSLCGNGMSGMENGNATESQFNEPSAIDVLDELEENILIVDTNNHRLRKYSLNSSQVSDFYPIYQ